MYGKVTTGKGKYLFFSGGVTGSGPVTYGIPVRPGSILWDLPASGYDFFFALLLA